MVFRSKIDGYFTSFLLIMILLIAIVSFFPFFIEEARNSDVLIPAVIILVSLFFIVFTFFLWSILSIRYIFHKDHLYIKGGFLKSQIPYEAITKVAPTTAIFTGHKVLSSRDAIEIFNSKTFMGSIKISPKNKKEFLNELKKRCPNIQIQE